MRTPFFSDISWDEVYHVRKDGPWIPDGVHAKGGPADKIKMANMKLAASKAAAAKADGTEGPGKAEGVKDEFEGFDSPVSPNGDATNGGDRKAPAVGGASKGGDDVDEAEEDDEIVPMRDSIFISGKDRNANALPDWSFLDSKTLAEVAKMCEDSDTA